MVKVDGPWSSSYYNIAFYMSLVLYLISCFRFDNLSNNKYEINTKAVLSDQYFDLSKTLKSVSFLGRTHYLPRLDNDHASLARSNRFYRDTIYASYIDNACYLEKLLKRLKGKEGDNRFGGIGFFPLAYILFAITSVFNSFLGVFKWLVNIMSKSTILFLIVLFVAYYFFYQIALLIMCLAVAIFMLHYFHLTFITIFG